MRKVHITATETFRDDYELPTGARVAVKDGETVEEGAILAHLPEDAAIAEPKTKTKTATKSRRKKKETPPLVLLGAGRRARGAQGDASGS